MLSFPLQAIITLAFFSDIHSRVSALHVVNEVARLVPKSLIGPLP